MKKIIVHDKDGERKHIPLRSIKYWSEYHREGEYKKQDTYGVIYMRDTFLFTTETDKRIEELIEEAENK